MSRKSRKSVRKQRLSKQPTSKSHVVRHRRFGRFEALESKTLLAADTALAAPLPVDEIDLENPPVAVVIAEGTDEADRISAFVDDDNMLHVVVNGDERVYDAGDIDGIYVNAKDGGRPRAHRPACHAVDLHLGRRR